MARNARWGARLGLVAVLMALPALEATAATLFYGQTINYQYYYPDLSSPYSSAANGNYVVGEGIEVFNIGENAGTLDISDTNLLVQFSRSATFSSFGSFNGFVITDIFGTIPDFTSITINPLTNMVGLDLSRISFTADQIFVNWQGLSITDNTIVSLDVTGMAPTPVPLPAALPMFLVGLAGLGFVGWRKKRRAAQAQVA